MVYFDNKREAVHTQGDTATMQKATDVLRVSSVFLAVVFALEISGLLATLPSYDGLTSERVVGNGSMIFIVFVVCFVGISFALDEFVFELLVVGLALVSVCVLSCLHFIQHPAHLEIVQTYLPAVVLVTVLMTTLTAVTGWMASNFTSS